MDSEAEGSTSFSPSPTENTPVKPAKIVGIVLLVCGTLSLVYGGFSYTKSESEVDLGPISFQVQERERVDLPIWLGVGLMVVGGVVRAGVGRKA